MIRCDIIKASKKSIKIILHEILTVELMLYNIKI